MDEIKKELQTIRESQIRTEIHFEHIVEDVKEQKDLLFPINRAYQSFKWIIGGAAISISLIFGTRRLLAIDIIPKTKIVKVLQVNL